MVDGIPNAARDGYLSRLRGFAGMNRMKRLALKLLASEENAVTMSEVAKLKVSNTLADFPPATPPPRT